MTITKPRSDRIVLNNISWQQLENILIYLGNKRSARLAYFDGMLEIMTPLPEHEYYKEAIGDAIKNIAEVLEIDYECYGSTTWRREARQAGIEPDNCFYFQNAARIRGQLTFDLNQDPPPDLALEIDVTSKSLSRFPIYARLGILELWCYEEEVLKIYQLQEENYIEVGNSLVFPELPIQERPLIIEQYRNEGRLAMTKAIKAWVNQKNKT